MKITHEGVNIHRLRANPLEAQFAEAWKVEAPGTLGYLLCGQDRRTHDYTARDAQVAATVIQWLGSPVGESFVRGVLAGKVKG